MQARFAELVEEAVAGKEVIVAKAGMPVARLIPASPAKKFGALEGKIDVPDELNMPLNSEVLSSFEG